MSALLLYAAKAALGLTLFYAVYALFLRNETHFVLNRAFLVAALALSFLIPAFPVASPFRAPTAAPDLSSLAGGPAAVRSLDPLDILALLYAAGVAVFLVRLGLHLARLAAAIRRHGAVRRDGTLIVSSDTDFSPFSFLGFVFLNEGGLEPGDVRRILAHERVHIRQLHSLDLLLMELATALLWFNPLVWPYKKSLQETHEYLADAGVIAQGFGGSGYRRLVFEQHVGARLFGVGNSFKQSQIHRRIFMMSRNPSAGGSRWKCLLAVPAALALVALFAVPRAAVSAPAAAQDKLHQVVPDKATQEKTAHALDELKKLVQVEADLKAAYESAPDDAARAEIKAKSEKLAQKRLEFLAKCQAEGIPLPPHAPNSDEAMALKAKATKLVAEIEAAKDPAAKADLEKKLAELKAKAAELGLLKTKLDASDPAPSLEKLKAVLTSLHEKEADLRAAIEKADGPEKRDELKKSLQMVLEKQKQIEETAKKAQAAEKPIK